MQIAVCTCGRQTHNPDGTCAVCKSFGEMQQELKEEGERRMAFNIPEKKCPECGREYKPSSGVQKRCTECGKHHNRMARKARQDTKKTSSRSVTMQDKKVEKATEPSAVKPLPKSNGTMPKMVAIDDQIFIIVSDAGDLRKMTLEYLLNLRSELLGGIGRQA